MPKTGSSSRESLLPPLWIGTLLICGLFIWLLLELKEIVVLLVVGYCIAYIMDPLLDYLERKKISRIVGFFVISGVMLIFLSVLAVTALPTIAAEYEKLSDNLPRYIEIAKDKVRPYLSQLDGVFPPEAGTAGEEPQNEIAKILSGINAQTIDTIFAGVLATLLKGYSITLTLINLFLLPFIVFYLAVDFNAIHRFCLALVPKAYRAKVREIGGEINRYVSAFVRGQLLVCSILFVLYAIGLGIVGIELWLLMAVIAGFGNMIPYFGFLCGITLSSIMALVTFGQFSGVLQVWIVFGIVQALEGFLITPKIIGGQVGLSPLIVVLSIFAGGQLFGLLGVFLAVPGAAALRVLGRHFHQWIIKKSEE